MVSGKAAALGRRRKSTFCNKCASILSTVALVSLAATMVFGVYWSVIDDWLYPVDTTVTKAYMSLESGSDEIHKVAPGTNVFINWHLDIHRSCPSTFQSTLTNLETNVVTILREHRGLAPEMGNDITFATRLHIPDILKPGKHAFNVRGFFDCNPISSQEVRYSPIYFVVEG